MGASDQLHASAALPPEKKPPVPVGQEVGWLPESVWTRWRREKSLSLPRIEPRLSNLYPTLLT